MDSNIQSTGKNKFNYLTAEDINYLDNLFAIYSSHVAHTSILLQFINKSHEEFENRNRSIDTNLFSLRGVETSANILHDTIETLTQSLILNIEKYFSLKYALIFKSLIPDVGTINLDPAQSYYFIIENIIGQVGEHLLEASK